MINKEESKYYIKNIVQHHLLNWIVISRYQMINYGIPKKITLRYLTILEDLLKKMKFIS